MLEIALREPADLREALGGWAIRERQSQPTLIDGSVEQCLVHAALLLALSQRMTGLAISISWTLGMHLKEPLVRSAPVPVIIRET